MDTPILHRLETFRGKRARMSMPGHKGKLRLFDSDIFEYDVTELPGTDNLLAPEGAIAESQQLFAAETGAAHAFYSVNGSSACVLAMLLYLEPGDGVIMARDFHKSAENALHLSGARPVYVELEMDSAAIPQPVETERMLSAIRENPGAKAVYITSPNYYGMCADIRAIAEAAHGAGMLLLVDAAHAAHFAYSPLLPDAPAQAGADIWCISLHKTLPACNQAAALCCGRNVDEGRLKQRLNMVQTTSPSYLLLASIDFARGFMAECGETALARLAADIEDFADALELPLAQGEDFSRLTVDVSSKGISGFEAAALLAQMGIYVEGADERRLLLIATASDGPQDFAAVAAAIRALPEGDREPEPGIRYTLRGELAAAGGLAQSVFAYPPGIPIWLAGQRPGPGEWKVVARLARRGYNLIGLQED